MSESIEQIEDELTLVALKFGVSKPLAADLSKALLECIKNAFEGDCLYIPKVNKQERNNAIKKRFNGVNHNEVCAEFEVSKSTLYRVLGER